jgi:penicillin amidase
MKIFLTFLSAAVTAGLIFLLNIPMGKLPPVGKFISPQMGFWQNAEPLDMDYSEELRFKDIIMNAAYAPKGKVDVFIDDRLVPHIFAEEEMDAYFVQGYLHAKFRLWQMEFQVRAAAGRLSEVLGEGPDGKILNYDRSMRRLGMIYAAERSVQEMEKNPVSKAQNDAYVAGVNAWIDHLKESELPLEYKLLNYQPQRWNSLQSALFLKYMSYDLAGHEDDLKFTNAKSVFSASEFEKLYPIFSDSLQPIVPHSAEQPYPNSPVVNLIKPATADSLYFNMKPEPVKDRAEQPDKDNGSNNWAVSGSKTKSGRPILCNDPHLALNFPSIWYEMQITTPKFSAYGATFPGSPNIIIGFNEYISFGFTNAGRDVKDYYEIKFKDAGMNEYWFNGEWMKTTKRKEVIAIKGKTDMIDTVAYTIFGPVIYDRNYPADKNSNKYLAVKWKAHDPSNDGYMFYGLNHATCYDDYAEAIKYLSCPGQNCIFASRSGDIALWQQGDFPAKWRRQGDFVMPGTDSSYMWRGLIPQQENPHQKNPSRGFVSSANQMAVDSTYPYYLGDVFPTYRGYIINRKLNSMNDITVDDMKAMQTDVYNVKAEFAKDILLQIDSTQLSEGEKRYFNIWRSWNFQNDAQSEGATIFTIWWAELEEAVWGDEFGDNKLSLPWPTENVLVESLHKDSAYCFIDNINTSVKETLQDVLLTSFRNATLKLREAETLGNLKWGKYKNSHVDHLIKIPAFSKSIPVGGGVGIINCVKEQHGPSWRMIVHMTDDIEAYGVYPGGQNGNPGSRFYDNFVSTWADGKYYRLYFMRRGDNDERIKWKMTFE